MVAVVDSVSSFSSDSKDELEVEAVEMDDVFGPRIGGEFFIF